MIYIFTFLNVFYTFILFFDFYTFVPLNIEIFKFTFIYLLLFIVLYVSSIIKRYILIVLDNIHNLFFISSLILISVNYINDNISILSTENVVAGLQIYKYNYNKLIIILFSNALLNKLCLFVWLYLTKSNRLSNWVVELPDLKVIKSLYNLILLYLLNFIYYLKFVSY